MNYEMPTPGPPEIPKRRTLGWWAREAMALPVVPNPSPEGGAEGGRGGKPAFLAPLANREWAGSPLKGRSKNNDEGR